MRFRFIRPLHGWRELIHEVIIVVIGALLALGRLPSRCRPRIATRQ